MGDRTVVTLTVLNEDADRVKDLGSVDDVQTYAITSCLVYYEVNYGELHFTKAMQEMDIPYSIQWERGMEYSGGIEFFMYEETGQVKYHSYYEGEQNPEIGRLLDLCDKPIALVTFIKDHAYQFKRPPWVIQREQSLIARAKKLIGA